MANKHTFVAGHYRGYWADPGSGETLEFIGTTINGFKIIESHFEEEINVDEGGEAVVDTLQKGKDVFVELDYAEYLKIKPTLYSQVAQSSSVYTNVATRGTELAGFLILDPVVQSGNTDAYYFPLALVHGNVDTLLATSLRTGPISFRIFPVQDDAAITAPDGEVLGAMQGQHYKVT